MVYVHVENIRASFCLSYMYKCFVKSSDQKIPLQRAGHSVLIQSSPVCYEVTSAQKLGGLGVNIEAGVFKDDVCADVAVVTTPAVPMTANLA